MPIFPNWTLSQESRTRMAELLRTASELGLDPDAVAAGGLAALQALLALKRAKEAGKGIGSERLIAQCRKWPIGSIRRFIPIFSSKSKPACSRFRGVTVTQRSRM